MLCQDPAGPLDCDGEQRLMRMRFVSDGSCLRQGPAALISGSATQSKCLIDLVIGARGL